MASVKQKLAVGTVKEVKMMPRLAPVLSNETHDVLLHGTHDVSRNGKHNVPQNGLHHEGEIAAHMQEILGLLGEDPAREGLVRTPQRYEKAMRYLLSGYQTDLASIVNGALFTQKYDEMVVVKDIEFFSMCEHHMLPFFGKMHIAYLPKNKVIGLSKLPRIVDMFARRLQLQERLTQQVAEAITGAISPRGVGVLCEAQHFCMMMRGVEKQHSNTVTSTMLGGFRKSKATRDEFLSLVKG